MFQYVLDLRRLLTLDQRMYPPRQHQYWLRDIKAELTSYMEEVGDLFSMEFQFDYIYLKTVADTWLALSKLMGHPWYRAVIETNCITS